MHDVLLVVDHKIVTDGQSHYTLRFVEQADGTFRPVLYHDGKRVTKPWRVTMSYEDAGDPGGASVNTA
jgi:hypothetical protein